MDCKDAPNHVAWYPKLWLRYHTTYTPGHLPFIGDCLSGPLGAEARWYDPARLRVVVLGWVGWMWSFGSLTVLARFGKNTLHIYIYICLWIATDHIDRFWWFRSGIWNSYNPFALVQDHEQCDGYIDGTQLEGRLGMKQWEVPQWPVLEDFDHSHDHKALKRTDMFRVFQSALIVN